MSFLNGFLFLKNSCEKIDGIAASELNIKVIRAENCLALKQKI